MDERTKAAIASFEKLMDILYLPAEYPGHQRFLCYYRQEGHTTRLVCALARRMAERVPASSMGVYPLLGLDWTSRITLISSLVTALEKTAPLLALRAPHNGAISHPADVRLRHLMDPPDDVPECVLTFVLAVPADALRDDMADCFYQLGALMAGSDHNWVVVAPQKITTFGEHDPYRSAFHALFEKYEVSFSPGDLPDELCGLDD